MPPPGDSSSRTSKANPEEEIAALCLQCGLCCDGTLFRDVELCDGDDPAFLEENGVSVQRLKRKVRFPQPCAALGADCRCRIYPGRPEHCRNFECLLLKATARGDLTVAKALAIIRDARRKADKVRALFRELGDCAEELPVGKRFRQLRRKIELRPLDDQTAELFSELSLAIHALNLLLGGSFYPGER